MSGTTPIRKQLYLLASDAALEVNTVADADERELLDEQFIAWFGELRAEGDRTRERAARGTERLLRNLGRADRAMGAREDSLAQRRLK